jgi:ApaG protein
VTQYFIFVIVETRDMELQPFYSKETRGIRITVRPHYLEEQSQPAQRRYVFVYFVHIENTSRRTVQLLSRRWHIHDSIGEEQEVVGDGVVGEQPTLRPGSVHEYHSFCILKSRLGYMEGAYRFVGRDDVLFEAEVPRFDLVADSMVFPFM